MDMLWRIPVAFGVFALAMLVFAADDIWTGINCYRSEYGGSINKGP